VFPAGTEEEETGLAAELLLARVELAGMTVEVEMVAVEVTAVVMTDGVLRTVVLPAVVRVWPTGHVVMVELTISVVYTIGTVE